MPHSSLVPLHPHDAHNQQLEANVHPADWANPTSDRPYHLVVIGAGTAGLVTAAGAAGLGARVALIERDLMGGDCLNVGCVPSKALLRAARVAAAVRDAAEFGVDANSSVDFDKVMERMRKLRADISPHDSAKRFSELGVDVYFGRGEFVDDSSIRVTASDGSESELHFRKAVIATGARASAPPIPGLDRVQYLTNETLFSLTELPRRLGVIGAGPIGCEMAQAFARFGSQVFLFEQSERLLPREDAEVGELLAKQFERDGISLLLKSRDMQVDQTPDGVISVSVERDGERVETIVDQLLVAVGRTPNTDMNLEAVNVRFDRHGVAVNDFLQTTNPRIFAAGDICSKYQFTHAADFQARIVIQNALFAIGPFGRKRTSQLIIPWSTYTSPEVAHVGLNAEQAASEGIEIDTYTQPLSGVDRAILDGQTDGFVNVHTKRGTDHIVGATIVADHAGDMISEITLAMKHGLGLSAIGATIHPYPTQADAIRKLGDQFNKTKLTSLAKQILGWLRWWNVGG